MKKTALLICLIFGLTGAQAQCPIVVGEKIAFIDSNGKIVNEGMFNRGTAFSEGIAAIDISGVNQSPKWFFIRSNYTIKIPYGYDTVGLFVGGLCPVKKSGTWFYIGEDGLIQFDGNFQEAGNFFHGKARVKDENGVYLINEQGEKIGTRFYEDISTWNDSLFGAKGLNEPFWTLFNYEGAIVLKDSFYGVYPSDNPIVCVNRLGGYRFVDYQGNLLFGKAFLEAFPFSQGWAAIRIENDWFLMDEGGKVKKDLRIKNGILVRGSMTPAVNYNGKAGILNRQGNWIYP